MSIGIKIPNNSDTYYKNSICNIQIITTDIRYKYEVQTITTMKDSPD